MNRRVLFVALLLSFLVAPLAVLSPVVFATTAVQTCTGRSSGTTTVSCTPGSDVTSGDVVVAACTSLNAPITSITDSYGTLSVSGSSTFLSGYGYVMIAAIAATSTISDTVTCNIGSGYLSSSSTISVIEVSGISPSGYTSSVGSGTGTALHTASSVTYGSNSFLVAAYIQSNGSAWTHGSGFTLLESNVVYFGGSQYGIFTSAGSSDFPMSLAGSEQWGGIGVAYKAGSASYNLFLLYPGRTPTSFPISNYPDSYVKLTYPDAPPSYIYNITSSSLNVDTHGANLLTVWIGTDYYVSIIPKDTTVDDNVNYVYLSSPAQEVNFDFQVNDFTGHFGAGTVMNMTDGASQVVFSGYTSSSNDMPMWLVPGFYNLTLTNDGDIYSTTVSISARNPSPSVTVTSTNETIPSAEISQYLYGVAWNCTGTAIVTNITDTLGTMTHVTVTLYRTNSSGVFDISSYSVSPGTDPGHPTSVLHDFVNPPVAQLTLSNSTQYAVGFAVTTPEGVLQIGPSAPKGGTSSCPGYLPPSTGAGGSFVIPNDLLGLNVVFTAANAYEELIAASTVALTGAIFGARIAHLAPLAMSMEMGVFFLMSWLPLVAGAVGLFLFIGSVGFLVNRARRPN